MNQPGFFDVDELLTWISGLWRSAGGVVSGQRFHSNIIIAEVNESGAIVVISQHPRRSKRLLDWGRYKWRHLIEHLFRKLKEFKRIAMRPTKQTKASALPLIHGAPLQALDSMHKSKPVSWR